MNLRHLHYFRVLAELEHFTQAAAKLAITQPSLSHAISELEKELGTYLFEKQGRNVRLTKYGQIFLTYVNSALNQLEQGERQLKEMVSPSHGKIDLSFIYTLGANFVPNLIKSFTSIKKNEHITFSFHQGTTNHIIHLLKEEKVDLALCSSVECEPDIDFVSLVEQDLVLVVSKDHPLAYFDRIDLIDTAEYPFILFSQGSGLRPIIDKLFSDIQITPQIICEVEEDHAMAGLVSINYGIAVMPNIQALQHYPVKTLKITNPILQRYIYLASIRNRYLSPATQQFKNFVIQYCNEHYLKNQKHI